jgi:hypothetical protein
MVNWDAHGQAFHRLSRQQKISTAKLLHQLINTNRQNKLYYRISDLCRGCGLHEESFHHLLTCPDSSMVDCRVAALDNLLTSLKAIGTPNQIVDALKHDFQSWDMVSHPVALTAGQLGASATLLTTAFHEQVHHIGWLHLHLG